MKRITLKTALRLSVLVICLGLFNSHSQAQIGGKLKEKAKEKVGGGKSTESTSTSTTNSGNNSTSSVAVAKKGITVSAPTAIMTTEFGGTTNQTSFEPGQDIFVRFAFPKPVGEAYAESQGMSDVPSTGSYYIVVAKNIDDENPIIMLKSNVFTSRYTKAEDNTMDFILQGSEDLFKKMEAQGSEVTSAYTFNSISSMTANSLSEEWKRQSALFQVKNYEWEMMLIFIPYNSDDESKVKFMCSTKFNYNVTAENKKIIAAGMNFYDKQRFEKTPDDGMVTDIHKKNVGKLVFSQSKMTKTFNDASQLKSSFSTFSGGIYARLYLKESMRNFYAEYGYGKDVDGANYRLNFYVDGATTPSCYADGLLTQDDAMKMTTWSIPLAPLNSEDFEYDKQCVNRFAYVMSELAPGKHKIRVEAKAQYNADQESSTLIGEGEFEITITAADRDAFVKKYGCQLPQKGMLATDAKLAADVKIISGKDAIDSRCPGVWEERKDAWGVVTHRVTIVAYSFKNKEGRGSQDTYMIKQPKTSSGWGATNATTEEKTWYGLDPFLPLQNSK